MAFIQPPFTDVPTRHLLLIRVPGSNPTIALHGREFQECYGFGSTQFVDNQLPNTCRDKIADVHKMTSQNDIKTITPCIVLFVLGLAVPATRERIP